MLSRVSLTGASPAVGSTGDRVAQTVSERRTALFRETPIELCERVVFGTAWALMPRRAATLLPLTRLWLEDLIAGNGELPHPEATRGSSEFAGIVRDLSAPTVLAAYARGLFPHGHFGPLKWTSPPRRCVLFFDQFHISRRLRSIMRQGKYTVTFDRDFEGVISACAGRRPGRWHLTWITPRIMHAYARLFDEGHVHSFEVWNKDGQLVGGGYGVALGHIFVIESQFSRLSNTSKIGFSVLAWHLAKWGFLLCDNKWPTPTTLQMGFCDIPRAEFLRHVDDAGKGTGRTDRWEAEKGAEIVAEWRPA